MIKVLLVNCSPRKNGNSNYLLNVANEYYSSKNNFLVECLDLSKMELTGCIACEYCTTNFKCFKEDETTRLLDIMYEYDLVVMFAPVYYCGFDSHTKKLIDRSYSLYSKVKENNGKIALVVSFGANSENNYIGMKYGFKYFAMSLGKEFVGIKPFPNTDNLTEVTKKEYAKSLIDFLDNINM